MEIIGFSYKENNNSKVVFKQRDKKEKKGVCSEIRSLISSQYARNFIFDFIIVKEQNFSLRSLF